VESSAEESRVLNDEEIKALVAAVILALSRCDLPRAVQIEVLERAAVEIRLVDAIDESALLQLVDGMN
jgi:hypothetical protein